MEYSQKLSQQYQQLITTEITTLLTRDIPTLISHYVTTGRKALDYGCGTGTFIPLLQREGYLVDGMDIEPSMLSQALTNVKNTAFFHINSAAIPKADKSYDLVILNFVLVEIGTITEITEVLTDIHRVLKPNGILIAITGNKARYTPSNQWLHIKTDFPDLPPLCSGSRVRCQLRGTDIVFEDYYWTDNDYKQAFETANLELIELHQPLGKPEDDTPWKDELHVSPMNIYITRKSKV
ncbi:class I SAM-dependent methyltransferase [Parendozoicomonas sp. Alg238-R29]|uniref:class I SAM-dependent methyltransferase n=1 Tax=Parendozoicomonas sp. Alg238-R29 TaxID=2993446 RepID=UPI00248E8F8E|nr:class I SAM-dependent methyltransferase [Parendozoicomonas sp. Alg238-R29]